MGHRAASTAAIAFDGVRVPRGNLIGNPGDGLRVLFASFNTRRRLEPLLQGAGVQCEHPDLGEVVQVVPGHVALWAGLAVAGDGAVVCIGLWAKVR